MLMVPGRFTAYLHLLDAGTRYQVLASCVNCDEAKDLAVFITLNCLLQNDSNMRAMHQVCGTHTRMIETCGDILVRMKLYVHHGFL